MRFAGAANFSQAGAALGVMLKTKSKELKQVAASASLSAWLVGITEPAIYGCNLRLKKPMVCAVIAGAVGGGFMGYRQGCKYRLCKQRYSDYHVLLRRRYKLGQFMAYVIGICVAFFGAAILTYLVGFEDVDVKGADVKGVELKNDGAEKAVSGETVEIASPVEGKAYPLNEVPDEVFASGALGQGIAVLPSRGEVTAPADCTVSVLYPTLHAMGLKLQDGTELLIHIGMDTVAMNGEGFEKHVNEGDQVKKGTLLVTFDMEQDQGCLRLSTTVSVIISNTGDFAQVTGILRSTQTRIRLLSAPFGNTYGKRRINNEKSVS